MDALLEVVPSFNATDLNLFFDAQPRPDHTEGLLQALESNYNIQNTDFKFTMDNVMDGDADLFDGAHATQLEIYLDRNRKLAWWIKHPALVPRELWPEALYLARKVGNKPLFLQSLLAISREGLRTQGCKRKRPQQHGPSSFR